MNDRNDGHLTDGEISLYLIEGPAGGYPTGRADAHLRSCATCQAKMAEAKAPLDDLRAAFVGWSAAQPQPAIAVSALGKERPSRNWGVWLPAAGVAMATVLLAVFLTGSGIFNRRSVGDPRAVDQVARLSATSDTALMDQVDAEVSESVPDAMAPLTDLVAWDSTASTSEKPVFRRKAAPARDAKARVHAGQAQ
jgi:hypothetical protein